MKNRKMNAIEFEAYAVTVTLPSNIDEYAKAFLHIFNNVREANELLKVDNYAWNNDVTVYCEIDSKEATIKYLENFGTLKSVDKVIAYQMAEPLDYDLDKYDEAIVVPYF
jgi:hypothetical protein